MPQILMMLEVSGKQGYIFGTKRLRDNAARSAQIAYVTGHDFFRTVGGDHYCKEENLIYAGGGHTVLQFDSKEQATAFATAISEGALRHEGGLELFVKQIAYNPTKTPVENLTALTAAMEEKKNLRKTAVCQRSFGVECKDEEATPPLRQEIVPPPVGVSYPTEFSDLSDDKSSNFLAVVHIDGNAMGKRVEALGQRPDSGDWDSHCKNLRRFSEGIQQDFEAAFTEMVEEVCLMYKVWETLPLRPVILAGDDVCFVADGRIGLECARIFLEKLATKSNEMDGMRYAACAGVALVHLKFPFFRAYALSEELCNSAKQYGVSLDETGSISVMDWHIEFGQMKDGLDEIRQDYETEDGNRLELRPVVVTLKGGEAESSSNFRSYAFFRNMTEELQKRDTVARGKLKELRVALKQGELESRFFLVQMQAGKLLEHLFGAIHGKDNWRDAMKILQDGGTLDRYLFAEDDERKRSLYFDAIEMMDHCDFFHEEVDS